MRTVGEISLKKFSKNIKSCKREKATPELSSEGQKYLYRVFIRKLMIGKPVCFGELDYERFDMDDIQEVFDFYVPFFEKPIKFYEAIYGIRQAAQPVNFI